MESPSDEEFELNRSNANANSNTNSYLTEQGKTYRPSHWFLGAIVGLFAVLLLGIASSYLVLLRGSLQPRVGLITGSSMEPTLRGPRAEFDCQACGSKSSWTMDTLDPSNEVSCQRCKAYLDTSYPTLVPGEKIYYTPVRPTSPPEIHRWDVVVIGPSDEELGQVKRVVGLPGEAVAIRGGRIWANGKMVCPEPEEFLRQAVLIDRWERGGSDRTLREFFGSIPKTFDNRLAINAHDSHRILPVQDGGISMAMKIGTKNWGFRLPLKSKQIDHELRCVVVENRLVVTLQSGRGDTSKEDASLPNLRSMQVHCLAIGGELILFDGQRVLWRRAFEELEVDWSEIDLGEAWDWIDQCRVVRGLYYRGVRDSDEQEFAPAGGWIVLGDNVSISEDSRYWEEGNERVRRDRVKGVVLRKQPER